MSGVQLLSFKSLSTHTHWGGVGGLFARNVNNGVWGCWGVWWFVKVAMQWEGGGMGHRGLEFRDLIVGGDDVGLE